MFQVAKWEFFGSKSWGNYLNTEIWFVTYWNPPKFISYVIVENLEHSKCDSKQNDICHGLNPASN